MQSWYYLSLLIRIYSSKDFPLKSFGLLLLFLSIIASCLINLICIFIDKQIPTRVIAVVELFVFSTFTCSRLMWIDYCRPDQVFIVPALPCSKNLACTFSFYKWGFSKGDALLLLPSYRFLWAYFGNGQKSLD